MDNVGYLIIPLLEGFEWFDESLQLSLQESGWPALTRPESMVMMHVLLNITRPSDIARSLRLTRQAVHTTIAKLVDRGIFELEEDAADGRIRTVRLSQQAEAMRHDARIITDRVTQELEYRIGARQVAALRAAFALDWGEPVVCRLDAGAAHIADRAGAAPRRPRARPDPKMRERKTT